MSLDQATSQRGWTLPATLFAIAVALATTRLVSLESVDTSLIVREKNRAHKLRAAVASTIRDSRPTTDRCERVATSHEGTTLTYEVCRERLRPFITVPPSVALPNLPIDYDAIFTRALTCPSQPTLTTRFGGLSPVARHDCALSHQQRGSTILLENILAESLSLSESGAPSLILATPGRIVISREVRLSRDLLVLAGGDVEIQAIRADAPIRVTLISSLGDIQVGSSDAPVSLLAAGRRAVEVPLSSPATEYPLPPLRPLSVYGFTSEN